jgi:hypothetical protein
MESFKLTIRLGNDAMKDGADIANTITRYLPIIGELNSTSVAAGNIRDANGNTVGKWSAE